MRVIGATRKVGHNLAVTKTSADLPIHTAQAASRINNRSVRDPTLYPSSNSPNFVEYLDRVMFPSLLILLGGFVAANVTRRTDRTDLHFHDCEPRCRSVSSNVRGIVPFEIDAIPARIDRRRERHLDKLRPFRTTDKTVRTLCCLLRK